ncbi:MAG: hypothetical protein CRN43_17825 [Candidatus Nephrothrix sp. EaCA]|nr:MAG: hypothetical protein CRN43_17825 [Candidatus Nephrothrix sp. EaCA]
MEQIATLTTLQSLIAGALLAVIGGVAGEWLRMQLEKHQERTFIKIGLSDELSEIHSTINRLKETFDKTELAHGSYLIDLANVEAYNHHRRRLFLLKGKDFRHKIASFYKRLNDCIRSSEGKVGTLADTPESKAEQKEIVTKLCGFANEAEVIKSALERKVWGLF